MSVSVLMKRPQFLLSFLLIAKYLYSFETKACNRVAGYVYHHNIVGILTVLKASWLEQLKLKLSENIALSSGNCWTSQNILTNKLCWLKDRKSLKLLAGIRLNYALSLCPAAGQVFQNTPCSAVKIIFYKFQSTMSNLVYPCLYGWILILVSPAPGISGFIT